MTTTAIALSTRPDGVPDGTAAADVVAADLDALRAIAAGATAGDVERALGRARRDLADFAALLSDAATGRLEDMAGLAPDTTPRRGGGAHHPFLPPFFPH